MDDVNADLLPINFTEVVFEVIGRWKRPLRRSFTVFLWEYKLSIRAAYNYRSIDSWKVTVNSQIQWDVVTSVTVGTFSGPSHWIIQRY